jgi:hypothetical protein
VAPPTIDEVASDHGDVLRILKPPRKTGGHKDPKLENFSELVLRA